MTSSLGLGFLSSDRASIQVSVSGEGFSGALPTESSLFGRHRDTHDALQCVHVALDVRLAANDRAEDGQAHLR